MIKVEYLLPFNTKDGICQNIVSFNSLLCSNSNISLTEGKLKFKGSSYSYSVSMNKVSEQDYTVFHVIFEINQLSVRFNEMLRSFKKTVGAFIQDDIQVIWDGVGFELSKELYPKIYLVENLMRKLISKFMLINLGVGWDKSAIPSEVKDSVKLKTARNNHGILYDVDFIQLSNVLFKAYAFKEASKLPEVISKALVGELNEEKRLEILEFIPKNNWDRYFSKIVDCESEQLQKKWTQLYEIRCIVAHNNCLSKDDFDSGVQLCEFLEPILTEAFRNLNKIEIPKKEVENISLNTIATVHEPTKSFIKDYNNFNVGLSEVINRHTDLFGAISSSRSPIGVIMDQSFLGHLKIAEPLKSSLNAFETTKNMLLSGESTITLKAATDNYSKLIEDLKISPSGNWEGVKPNLDFGKYLEFDHASLSLKTIHDVKVKRESHDYHNLIIPPTPKFE